MEVQETVFGLDHSDRTYVRLPTGFDQTGGEQRIRAAFTTLRQIADHRQQLTAIALDPSLKYIGYPEKQAGVGGRCRDKPRG